MQQLRRPDQDFANRLDLLICEKLGLDPHVVRRISSSAESDAETVTIEVFSIYTARRDDYERLIAEARKPDPGTARARLAEMVAAGQVNLCRAGRPVDPSEEEAQMLLDFAAQLATQPAAARAAITVDGGLG